MGRGVDTLCIHDIITENKIFTTTLVTALHFLISRNYLLYLLVSVSVQVGLLWGKLDSLNVGHTIITKAKEISLPSDSS